jgi:hypothetical protein
MKGDPVPSRPARRHILFTVRGSSGTLHLIFIKTNACLAGQGFPGKALFMMRVLPVVLAFVALTATACNNNSNSSTPTLASPTINDVDNGTVQPGSSDFRNFTVTQSGEVDIYLNSAVETTANGPLATIQMNVGIGTPLATTCPMPLTYSFVTVAAGPNAIGAIDLNAGTYCVDIFDAGNQSCPVTYTITVAHP